MKSNNWPGKRALLVLLVGILVGQSAYNNWLDRWDSQILDIGNRIWSRPAPNDIVIVAIDQYSLNQLGAWPWPRSLHAGLISQLTQAGARGILMDIIFAEPDPYDPTSDQILTSAIKQNGNTVLPVLAEQPFKGAELHERLPIAPLADAAAALGHVHVELDRDGIARRIFLREGLGGPHWPWIGLALLQHLDDLPSQFELGQRSNISPSKLRAKWDRDQHIIIPFAGPPGHFQRISYVDALDGNFLPNTFKDKLILVGATATGLSDALPTPVSGLNQAMPGVEFNANVLDSLRQNLAVTPVPRWITAIAAGGIAMAALISFILLPPRWTLHAAIGWLILVLSGSFALLALNLLWLPPASATLAIVLSYPLWSWLRLSEAMRFLDDQLKTLRSEQKQSPLRKSPPLNDLLNWILRLMPNLQAIAVTNAHNQLLGAAGDYAQLYGSSKSTDSSSDLFQHVPLIDTPSVHFLHLHLLDKSKPCYTDWLVDMVSRSLPQNQSPHTELERFHQRLDEVQSATDDIRALRAFIDSSIHKMADGFIAVGDAGQIIMANRAAIDSLGGDPLLGRDFLSSAGDKISSTDGQTWATALYSAFVKQESLEFSAESKSKGQDFIVRVRPLILPDAPNPVAVVINFADISQLRASERKRAEILGFVSHDLRSPLVSVLALVDLARHNTAQSNSDQTLARIEGYAHTTLQLAEQVLQLARAENPEGPKREEMELTGVANNAIEQVWSQARSANSQIDNALPDEPVWLIGDPEQIERALTNLLTNAIKYSPKNTHVTVTLSDNDGDMHCCIADQGVGISEPDQATLFYRFRRLPGTAHRHGAGLGLAYVKAVAEAHSGRIDVRSKVGQGSNFCLVLPASLRIDDDEQHLLD